MRATFRYVLPLLAVLAAYTAWPFVDLYRLGKAVERRDAAAVSGLVEFRTLRASVNRQVLAAYLRLTGKEARLGPFGDLALGAATSALDPLLADIVSAERLIALFAGQGPGETLPGAPAGKVELWPSGSLGRLFDLYWNSDYSFTDFTVPVPAGTPLPQRFKLHLRLIRWHWKLKDVQLPDALAVHLARELMKAAERK